MGIPPNSSLNSQTADGIPLMFSIPTTPILPKVILGGWLCSLKWKLRSNLLQLALSRLFSQGSEPSKLQHFALIASKLAATKLRVKIVTHFLFAFWGVVTIGVWSQVLRHAGQNCTTELHSSPWLEFCVQSSLPV